MKIIIFILIAGFYATAASASGASLLHLKSGTLAGFTLQNSSGIPLSAGTTLDGDGTLLEFGYYSGATSSTPFAGMWIPLSGPDSAAMIVTTIGDGLPPADGVFSVGLRLDNSLLSFPDDGTPLSLRFYNGKTRFNSTAFNAVANSGGLWNSDSSGMQINILIGDRPGTVWQGGPASAFRTTIPIPESGAAALAATALAAALLVRRRAAGKLQAMHSKAGPT